MNRLIFHAPPHHKLRLKSGDEVLGGAEFEATDAEERDRLLNDVNIDIEEVAAPEKPKRQRRPPRQPQIASPGQTSEPETPSEPEPEPEGQGEPETPEEPSASLATGGFSGQPTEPTEGDDRDNNNNDEED